MPEQKQTLKVMVVGLRGFPHIQVGIETHAEHLYPELVKLGCDVEVIVRRPYVEHDECIWKGVKLKALWSPTATGLEALVHSFLAVIYAIIHRPDVLHVHAIGPALFVPLARLFGLHVVVTHHGMDYHRQKWGVFAKTLLKVGEWFAVHFANHCITVSQSICEFLLHTYGERNNIVAIHNGVDIPELVTSQTILEQFNLKPKKYFLMVSRFVPEKRQDDLIRAFLASDATNKRKLILVGDYNKAAKSYINTLETIAQKNPQVVFTGFQKGEALASLYANAECFFLPSSHEGLPIALLEALSYGLYPVVSDIPAHLEMNLPQAHYFRLGDVEQLAKRMSDMPEGGFDAQQSLDTIEHIRTQFDWTVIAQQTYEVLSSR